MRISRRVRKAHRTWKLRYLDAFNKGATPTGRKLSHVPNRTCDICLTPEAHGLWETLTCKGEQILMGPYCYSAFINTDVEGWAQIRAEFLAGRLAEIRARRGVSV